MNVYSQWFNMLRVGQNYNTMHYFAGTGGDSFDINFAGGYLDKSHVKAVADDGGPVLTVTFVTPSRVRLSRKIQTGSNVLIFRDTPKVVPLAMFSDGAVLNNLNLDRNSKQAVFVAAEMLDRFDTFGSSLETSVEQVSEALRIASDAHAVASGIAGVAYAANKSAEEALDVAKSSKEVSDMAISEVAGISNSLVVSEKRTLNMYDALYTQLGYRAVGFFEDGFTFSSKFQVGIVRSTGKAYTGTGTVTPGTNPELNPTYSNVTRIGFAFSVQDIAEEFAKGAETVQAHISNLTATVAVPMNRTLIMKGVTRISHNANAFELVTGSRVYGDFVIGEGNSPTVFYVDGTHRPTMLLADNRKAGAFGTIKNYGALPAGRALFLDGSSRNGKRGIISWFECDVVARNLQRGCDVIAANPQHVDSAKSYVNNNYIKLALWDCPYGYIEEAVDLRYAEIASNDIHIDYQSSAVSVKPVQIRGTRNRVKGNLWDMDRPAYPLLTASSVDIGGSGNDVGGVNWPSAVSNVVTISDPMCNYTGYAYGTAKSSASHLTVFGRLGVIHGLGVEGAVVSRIGSTGSTYIEPGSVLKGVVSRTVGMNASRLPYSYDGYILLKNTKQTPVTVQVRFGLLESAGALSNTVTVQAERAMRMPLSMFLNRSTQAGTCDTGSWYGSLDLSLATTHQLHIQVTSVEGIHVEGVHLTRVGEL